MDIMAQDVPIERWQPLGANSSPEISRQMCESSDNSIGSPSTINKLASENEQLNSSLVFLTSHFAQVQFRLDQVMNADSEDKEQLLTSLKEFTTKGLPDVRALQKFSDSQELNFSKQAEDEQKLIDQLRSQLHDLEYFALEHGKTKNLPMSEQLKRHQLVIQKLKDKLDLSLNELEAKNMSEAELNECVDSAVNQVLNPIKSNEKLVEQLKTQIVDLERFIEFLHDQSAKGNRQYGSGDFKDSKTRETTINIMKRALTVLQLFALSQMNGNKDPQYFRQMQNMCQADLNPTAGVSASSSLKKPSSRNSAEVERIKAQHWGDVRARLELAIEDVLEKIRAVKQYEESDEEPKNSPAAVSTPTHSSRLKSTSSTCSSSATMTKIGSCSSTRRPSTRLPPLIEPNESAFAGNLIAMHEQIPTDFDSDAREITERSQREHENSDVFDVEELSSSFNFFTDTREFLREAARRELINSIRRNLCTALRELIEHGLNRKSDLKGASGSSSGGVISNNITLQSFMGCFAITAGSKNRNRSIRNSSSRRTHRQHKHLTNGHSSDKAHRASKKPIFENHVTTSAADEDDVPPAVNGDERWLEDDDEDEDVNVESDEAFQDDYEEEDEEYNDYTIHRSHAWHLFLRYYDLKDGEAYNSTPARKLSQSFDLEIVGGRAITTKQHFLSAMGTVIQLHEAFKRSDDSQFKAFISLALNERKLVPWLKLVLRNRLIVDSFYHAWSYTASTGFEDALDSLNRLRDYEYSLPYDMTVRHLLDIKDAF